MLLIVIFCLGVGNFALHKAVLESGHPLIRTMPWFSKIAGMRLTLLTEFMVLFSAMLLAANGWPAVAWVYAIYSVMNGFAGWLILRRQI